MRPLDLVGDISAFVTQIFKVMIVKDQTAESPIHVKTAELVRPLNLMEDINAIVPYIIKEIIVKYLIIQTVYVSFQK